MSEEEARVFAALNSGMVSERMWRNLDIILKNHMIVQKSELRDEDYDLRDHRVVAR